MKFTLPHVYALLSLALVGSHAMSPQVYWKSVLPDSPMPRAIKDLLFTKAWDDGEEKISTDTTSNYIKLKDQPEQHYSNIDFKEEVKDHPPHPYIYGPSEVEVKDQPPHPYIYGASDGEVKDQPPHPYIYNALEGEVKNQPPHPYIYNDLDGDVKDHSPHPYIYGALEGEVKDQPPHPYVYGASEGELNNQPPHPYIYGIPKDVVKHQHLHPYIYGSAKGEIKDQPPHPYIYSSQKGEVKDQPPQPYIYGAHKWEVKTQSSQPYIYNAPKSEARDNPIVKLLFLENNLHQREELKLHFIKTYQKTAFLPKNISDSIPFSLNDLSQIYNKFSVKPDSVEAEILKEALILCENKGIKGEETFCATSLESMVEFVIKKLGKKVKALSTEMNTKKGTPSQKYKVELVKKLASNKVVVCHRQNYAYAVFYCHISIGTQSYVVSLDGADGTKVKSMAVCHTDTSEWNPKHVAFQSLKVAPGISVCHFLPEDHVLWVPY